MAATVGIAALMASPVAAQKNTISRERHRNQNWEHHALHGPASAYGEFGKTEAAYFRRVNAEGGINGRKINFISYDDAYSPPKTVEQARKLVESDEVLLIFQSLGTPSNTAIQRTGPIRPGRTTQATRNGRLSWTDIIRMVTKHPHSRCGATWPRKPWLRCSSEAATISPATSMKQAASLKNLDLGMLLSGIRVNTGPTDFAPVKQMQMERFNGERFELFGPLISGDVGG
jgi:hypothetical protein